MAPSDPSEYAMGQAVDRLTRAAETLVDGNLSGARACLNEAGAWLDEAITSGTGVPWLLEDDGETPVVSRLAELVRKLTEQIEPGTGRPPT